VWKYCPVTSMLDTFSGDARLVTPGAATDSVALLFSEKTDDFFESSPSAK